MIFLSIWPPAYLLSGSAPTERAMEPMSAPRLPAICGILRFVNPYIRPYNCVRSVINAIIHNDYSYEGVPKFELFADRLEITSTGSIPHGLTESEFFEGYSMPRNKELMRIFRDLDLVEHLGSGMPRILQAYPKSCFRFTDNFIRMSFPTSGKTNATQKVR